MFRVGLIETQPLLMPKLNKALRHRSSLLAINGETLDRLRTKAWISSVEISSELLSFHSFAHLLAM